LTDANCLAHLRMMMGCEQPNLVLWARAAVEVARKATNDIKSAAANRSAGRVGRIK